MEYIKRHMEDLVLELTQSYAAILLTGPRQAGKTTLLRSLLERENIGRSFVSLVNLEDRELAKTDPPTFLQRYPPPVLIDEVQYAPELFTYIKIHIDEHYRPGDFWMSGSQIYRAMKGVQESLAGRVALLCLPPLSQREIIGAPNAPFTTDFDRLLQEQRQIEPVSISELYTRIWRGSMPGVINGMFPNRKIFYSSYISTYLARDVKDISGDIDALDFLKFIRAAAARCAQILNYKSLADDAEIDVTTAKKWLNILETLGIVFLLHPYSNNVLKRTIRTPKLYFYDTGLVCHLTRWSTPESVEIGNMNGALLENFVISEITKGYQNAGLEPYLYFYRDRDGNEIDVVMEYDGKLYPLEIKKTSLPDKRITNAFNVIDKFPLQRGTGAVLCTARQFSAFDKDNLIVPVWMV